jgi:predicted O-linked N-acetylglucosamine transferase (SPINDLY family)
MILKSRPFADADTRARYIGLFSDHGLGAARIDLLPFLDDQTSHLRAYDRLDIALDPFPYSGTTTSCEALWMGVPVVTLAGGNHVSRVTASLLTTCGLPGLIATDEGGYVERAVALAADWEGLATLRRTMRARLLGSPLTDYTGFARRVEAAYRAMLAV